MKSKEVWFEGRINRREYFARGIVCLSLILLALAPVFLHIVRTGRRIFPSPSVPEQLFAVPLIAIARGMRLRTMIDSIKGWLGIGSC